MTSDDLKQYRKEMFGRLEKKLCEYQTEEDSDIFFYHPSEEHIILSHALFWVMTASVSGKIAKEEYFLLLRRFQGEMLEAYLTADPYFPELLRYCNIMYNILPYILTDIYDLRRDKTARKLASIATVAAGYGGDMADELCDDLLDDIDFVFNKVRCLGIEQMLPLLNRMVEDEMKMMEKEL